MMEREINDTVRMWIAFANQVKTVNVSSVLIQTVSKHKKCISFSIVLLLFIVSPANAIFHKLPICAVLTSSRENQGEDKREERGSWQINNTKPMLNAKKRLLIFLLRSLHNRRAFIVVQNNWQGNVSGCKMQLNTAPRRCRVTGILQLTPCVLSTTLMTDGCVH